MGLVSMVYSDLTQSYGVTSMLFSGYKVSLLGRALREKRGGATKILSQIVVESMETNLIYGKAFKAASGVGPKLAQRIVLRCV